MATAAAVAVEPMETECSVCHEDFTDPKVLPCGHLLCRHCLVTWLNAHTPAHCPLCRCAILDPNTDTETWDESAGSLERSAESVEKSAESFGQNAQSLAKCAENLEKIAESFPTDLAMKAVTDAERLLKKDHSCCVCDDVAATSLCLDCGDMLCQACTKVHGKLSSSKHHSVEQLATLTPETLADKQQETCSLHGSEPCRVFCPTHGASLCLLCATTDHRQCPDVTKLETKLDETRAKLLDLASILSEGEMELDKAVAQLDQHVVETEQRIKAAIAEIHQMCDRLEETVKACRDRLTKLAETASDDVKEAVQDGKTCLLNRRGKLTLHKQVIHRVQARDLARGVVEFVLRMEPRVMKLFENLTVLPDEMKVVCSVKSVFSEKALSQVEEGLKSLAQVVFSPVGFIRQVRVFSFSTNHGSEIQLSNNKMTAEKNGQETFGGIVMSETAMEVNKLYEIRLEARVSSANYMLPFGVVTTAPDEVSLPKSGDSFDSWTSAIVVGFNHVHKYGCKIKSSLGATLNHIPEGSCVGLALDSDRNLQLYLNGTLKGTAANSVADPAYVLFDLQGPYRKITTLPVTSLK